MYINLHTDNLLFIQKIINMELIKKETYKKPTIEIIEMEMERGICINGGGYHTKSSPTVAPEPEGYNTRD